MGKSSKAPTPPDPIATAKAQGEMNTNTAITQSLLNQVDQYTPDGNITYNQTGTNSFVGADGKTYNIPKFTGTQTYTGVNKDIYDVGKQTELNIAGIGRDQSAKIGSLLGTNVNLNNEAVEGRLFDLGSKRLNPQFARGEEALRTRLTNQGIMPGSAAWNAELGQFGETKNDAFNQLLLSGRGQSVQELLAERNQPINEISALMSGSQVSQPNFVSTANTPVAGVDYTGLVNNNYNAQLAAWQAKQAQQGAALGGLFGTLGTLGSAAIKFSDRRLKTDIRLVGATANGLPLYAFRYIWGGATELGVMADEVLRVRPDAVHEIGGYLAVDYEKALA